VDFDLAVNRGALPDLEFAVSLYKGPLLEGCSEEWVPQERIVRERECLQAMQKLAESVFAVGNYEAAAEYYIRAVAIDPWSDTSHRGLMEALAKLGDLNEALRIYREFSEFLKSETGSVPDERTTTLYRRLRTESRRSLAAQERESDTKRRPKVSGYLPHSLTELVGREDEKSEIGFSLRKSRLVTLTGPGGIGKTRLAIEVAKGIAEDFDDGVWLVPLESISNGVQVDQRVADVLDLKEILSRPIIEALIEYLADLKILIVLDNCEHVIQDAAQVTSTLLRSCPGVRVLATSREPLGITGEVIWNVPALVFPNIETLPPGRTPLVRILMGYESVQLFVERAQSIQKSFAITPLNALAIARICALVEGIPLAIELAAARVKSIGVEEIAQRLDDRLGLLVGGDRAAQGRQQTLRETLDWSYELLSEPNRVLLARLSVFVGGWSLDAAEKVCGDGTRPTIMGKTIQDLLGLLVDKSLVIFGMQGSSGRDVRGRYRLLETVRQYGSELLCSRNEFNRMRTQHFSYFLELAQEVDRRFFESEQAAWLSMLETDHANLRHALDWSVREEIDPQSSLTLVSRLGKYWELHGHYTEGRAYLSKVLGREGAEEPTLARARALNSAGVLAYCQGDIPSAEALLREGIEVSRHVGNKESTAWLVNNLADVISAQGADDLARELYSESLAMFRELGDQCGIASLIHHLARLERDQGNFEQARRYYSEGVAIQSGLGNKLGVAWSLHHLGNLSWRQHDVPSAWSVQNEALSIFRALGSRQGIAWSLNELGIVSFGTGEIQAATRYFGESLEIFTELGNSQGISAIQCAFGDLYHSNGEADEAWKCYRRSLAIRVAQGNQAVACECLAAIADLALVTGQGQDAVRLWATVQAVQDETGRRLLDSEKVEIGKRRVRSEIGAGVFEAYWSEGYATPWQEAAAKILAS
jgi:predicted ATPase